MKKLNSREYANLIDTVRFSDGKLHWREGLDFDQIRELKYRYKLKPKYYYIRGKSYIFHEDKSKYYICVTKMAWDNH